MQVEVSDAVLSNLQHTWQSASVCLCNSDKATCRSRDRWVLQGSVHALKAVRTAGSVKNSSRSSFGFASPSTWSTYHCTCARAANTHYCWGTVGH